MHSRRLCRSCRASMREFCTGRDWSGERIEREPDIGRKQIADDHRIALTDRATTTRVCRLLLPQSVAQLRRDSDGGRGMERDDAEREREPEREGDCEDGRGGESDLLFHRSLLHTRCTRQRHIERWMLANEVALLEGLGGRERSKSSAKRRARNVHGPPRTLSRRARRCLSRARPRVRHACCPCHTPRLAHVKR